ncbi:cytochrome P450 family 97G-CYP97G1 [Gracilaria domingensis]|nr:cytochrome P450 family 97G-CYP97G1 [Gracilaria domingensis]
MAAFVPAAFPARVAARQRSPPLCDARARRRQRVSAALVDPPSPAHRALEPPAPLTLRDTFDLWVDNILQTYGHRPCINDAPSAEGDTTFFIGGEPFFVALHRSFLAYGPIYKLCFGPKVFYVVQDPIIARSILKENNILYDKGVLAEVLDEIMGKGLIPADYATWKIRRRAIVPGFHAMWLKHMTSMFGSCTQTLCDKLQRINGAHVLDMETEYSSLALDIIGKAVFNFEFNSITSESPIIKAVYRTLKETEHRSMSLIPYWKIPGAKVVVPRLRAFYSDMKLINETLNTLILSAKRTATAQDLTELENRDYENVTDPSLLRFLVELRGEQTTNQQLRDDLMTLLIAGHETTAAVLTWTTVELAKHPEMVRKAREEIDAVVGDGHPTYEHVQRLSYLRRLVAESLRLYPAPPLLIRRLLADTTLPKGAATKETPLRRGTDVFINVYSLHRSPDLWDNPETFDPDRWLRPKQNPGVKGWRGYNPASGLEDGSPLYPTEVHADFAFLPFGGGSRKCVGDHFAILESVVALAMIIRRFDFEFANPSQEVQMTTGATIHTKNGLNMRLYRRKTQEANAQTKAETTGVEISAM